MSNVPELFGSNVFNENVMKERLPKAVYKALKKTIQSGNPLGLGDPERSNPLHPLVPAFNRLHRRKTR